MDGRAATPLGRRKPTHIWRRDQSKTASGWGSFIIDSTRFLAKRRCSETLATKVTLARSWQVAREESTSPLLGLGVGPGHGPLGASWVAAAPHVPQSCPGSCSERPLACPALYTGLVHSLPTSRREEELWGVADITHKEGTFQALRSLVWLDGLIWSLFCVLAFWNCYSGFLPLCWSCQLHFPNACKSVRWQGAVSRRAPRATTGKPEARVIAVYCFELVAPRSWIGRLLICWPGRPLKSQLA